MGLTASLALLRAHVLVVAVPGRALLRLRAEAAVRDRGWLLVAVPEDADLLLVCGAPQGAVAAAADGLWRRVPAARARRTVVAADGLDAALDSAARVLADGPLQRRSAPPREVPAPPDRAPLRFGPLGRDWPSGLALECALDGHGRIEHAAARLLPREPADPDVLDDALRAVVLDLAAGAALLRAAGWRAPAARVDRAVDAVLDSGDPEGGRAPARAVAESAGRSVVLRWSLGRAAPGLDVRERLLALLADPGRDRPDWRPGAALEGLAGRLPDEVPLRVAAAGWEHADA